MKTMKVGNSTSGRPKGEARAKAGLFFFFFFGLWTVIPRGGFYLFLPFFFLFFIIKKKKEEKEKKQKWPKRNRVSRRELFSLCVEIIHFLSIIAGDPRSGTFLLPFLRIKPPPPKCQGCRGVN